MPVSNIPHMGISTVLDPPDYCNCNCMMWFTDFKQQFAIALARACNFSIISVLSSTAQVMEVK